MALVESQPLEGKSPRRNWNPLEKGIKWGLVCGIRTYDRTTSWVGNPDNRIMLGYLTLHLGLALINKSNPAAGLLFEIGFAAFNTYLQKSSIRESLDS